MPDPDLGYFFLIDLYGHFFKIGSKIKPFNYKPLSSMYLAALNAGNDTVKEVLTQEKGKKNTLIWHRHIGTNDIHVYFSRSLRALS